MSSALSLERVRLQRAATGAFSTADPLASLHAYATFLGAHFPADKQALYDFLRTTTDTLKDRTDLHGDERGVDLWLLYARRVNRPNAVYAFMLKRRIGTGYARTFLEYAAWLEKNGDRVKADAVYRAGIARKVQELSKLEAAYKEFLAGDSSAQPSVAAPAPAAPAPAMPAATAALQPDAEPDPWLRPPPTLPPPDAWAFAPPGPGAPADERAAWKRLTYVRQYVRAGGALAGAGRRPERLVIDLMQSFTREGKEMSFEEARAAHLGLLDLPPDHFDEPEPEPEPEPIPEPDPVPPMEVEREVTATLGRSRVVDDDAETAMESDDDVDDGMPPPHAPRTDSDAAPSTSSSSEDLHGPPPVLVTRAPDDSDASFSSLDSPEPPRTASVNFDGPMSSTAAGGRTTVLRRMGGMGLGAVAPGAEPTVTINTKESLDDVFAMMNSPEKTMRSGALPGAKYAPVRAIAPTPGRAEPRLPALTRTLSDENAGRPGARVTFQPFVDEDDAQPSAGPSIARTPSASFRPFVDGEDDATEDLPPSHTTATPGGGRTPFRPFMDPASEVARAVQRTPAVDENGRLPKTTPRSTAFTPFADKSRATELPAQTPSFRPFVDENAPAAPRNETRTPGAASSRVFGDTDKSHRTPFSAATPVSRTLSPAEDLVEPVVGIEEAVDIDTDEDDPRSAAAHVTAGSSSDHSGSSRPVLSRSLSGTLVADGKASVFVPRSRTGSASGDVFGLAEDRSRTVSGGSVASVASTSVFRPPGGSVFSRPAGPVFTKTPAPFKPQSKRILGEVAQPSLLSPTFSARLPPEPSEEPMEPMVEIEAEPSPIRPAPPILSAFNLAPPSTLDDLIVEDVHTPVEEIQPDLRVHRQHVGRFGAVNLMTPIAERTLEFTGARSVVGTPSRGAGTGLRPSKEHALLVTHQLVEELREEDEDAELESAPVAQTLFSGVRHTNYPSDGMDAESTTPMARSTTPTSPSPPCNPFMEDSPMYRALDYLVDAGGFHNCADRESHKLEELQRFAKKATGARMSVVFAGRKFLVTRKVGEGSFGAVFSARDCGEALVDAGSDDDDDDDGEDDDVALKIVRPAHAWEFSMIRELHRRLPERERSSVIDARELFLFHDESILVLDLCTQGTLLDVVNRAGALGLSRAGQPLDELVAMFFAIELLRVLEALHSAGFIHGDLKADNVLVHLQPASDWAATYSATGSGGWAHKGVALVDFGRAIDTHAFAPEQTFIADWPTDERDAPQLRAGTPWTFELDYFGLAGILFCMLFGRHLDAAALVQQDGRHRLAAPVKRYWQGDIWNPLFDVLLNPADVHPDGRLPLCDELAALRGEMELWLEQNSDRSGQTSLRQSLKRIERGVL